MNLSTLAVAEKIGKHDTSLFATIQSQSTDGDRKSLLVIHSIIRRILGSFIYLEIGSHLGGSLQAMVADPSCTRIISIDPRPEKFCDERGIISAYPKNSSQCMLDLLKTVPQSDISKIKTIELDSSQIELSGIGDKPQFCFIDGEHTDVAALRDARFCLKLMNGEGIIAFHDANVIYAAIDTFIQDLNSSGIQFRAFILADSVFVVELGKTPRVTSNMEFIEHLQYSHRAFLSGLKMNAWYRAVLNQPCFLVLRRIRFIRRLFMVKNFQGGQPI